MDEGRYKDLEKLDKAIRDEDAPKSARLHAHRAKWKILKQLEDKQLSRMRTWLIRAYQAGDKEAVKRFERQIKYYEKEHYEEYE